MCTLTLAWRVFADTPVAVAANRDEALDRPSEPPHRWSPEERATVGIDAGDPELVAPRDARAGGTWMGYNDRGLVAGITNRWVDVDHGGPGGGRAVDPRSRGRLVTDCLAAASAEAAARLVEESVERDAYEGFNLVLADADAAILLEWDGRLRVRHLRPGVHVVVNVGTDGDYIEPPRRPEAGPEQAENARRLRRHLQPEPGSDAAAWLDRAGEALGDHDFGVCVHGDGFGTVSSTLLALPTVGEPTWCIADGPPCETGFEPVGEALTLGE